MRLSTARSSNRMDISPSASVMKPRNREASLGFMLTGKKAAWRFRPRLPATGQGRELIERALPYEFGARTTFALEADGAHCTISLPVPEQ
jgi:hypothetical protein